MEIFKKIQLILELHGIIFSLLMMFYLILEKPKKYTPGRALAWCLLDNTFVLANDMLALIYQGDPTEFGSVMNVISNYGLYVSQYLLVIFFGWYIYLVIRPNQELVRKKWLYVVNIMASLGLVGVVINIFVPVFFYFDSANYYQRAALFPVSMIIGGVPLLIQLYEVIRSRKELSTYTTIFCLALYFVAPVLGMAIQIVMEGISFMNLGITISVFGMFIAYEISWRKQRKRQEQILLQSQAYLLNSQIQPHFIFNSLNCIQALIAEDPDTAEEAISHFSKYLRKGLNLKVNESLISIWDELDYVENYLYLEKLRFGDKLNISYNIEDGIDFELPFLSVQPLVENAIRHGIRKKVEGGTVSISIHSGKRWNVIQVIDDGIGFDIRKLQEKNPDPNSNGVGFRNIEERIRLMCNGFVNVTSTLGKGTVVTVYIPS